MSSSTDIPTAAPAVDHTGNGAPTGPTPFAGSATPVTEAVPRPDPVTDATAPTALPPAPARRNVGALNGGRDRSGPEVRRVLHAVRQRDVLPVVMSVVAAAMLGYLVYYILLPWQGLLGFVVVVYGLFLAMYTFTLSFDESRTAMKDRFATVVMHSFAVLMMSALVTVVVFTLIRGSSALRHLNFFVTDLSAAGPQDPLTEGGVIHAIFGTLIMMSIALAITIPLGITAAVFLSETRGPFARFVRTIVEAMTALPSIIAGLFIYAGLILLQSLIGVGERSGFAASLAITVMMLPIVIRAADVVLRLVPGTLKEAASALGAPRWRVVWHVTLPTARSGLLTAVILGTARGIGETSPVLLTAGNTPAVNLNPGSGPMVSLPLATYLLTRSPDAEQITRGFGAASVLLILVLILFTVARVIGGRPAGELSRAQTRRRAAQSLRDLARYERHDARNRPARDAVPVTGRPGAIDSDRPPLETS